VTGTVEDLLRGTPLAWRVCSDGDVALPAGEITVDATRSAEFAPTALTVTRRGMQGEGSSTRVDVARPDGAHLDTAVPGSSTTTVLVVPQNFSTGWVALDTDGSVLEPIRVNGWQQGWFVPAGTARTVAASFGPDRPYRLALAGGALLLLGCLMGAVWPARREGQEVLAARVVRGWAWNLGVVVALSVLAGPLGALAGGAALVLCYVLRSTAAEAASAFAALVVAAVFVAASAAWPESRAAVDDSVVQVLVLIAVALCVSAPVGGAGTRGWVSRRSLLRPQRMTGRSTTK
jgi:arabinofuranan 3-O-arabinosyltransferase